MYWICILHELKMLQWCIHSHAAGKNICTSLVLEWILNTRWTAQLINRIALMHRLSLSKQCILSRQNDSTFLEATDWVLLSQNLWECVILWEIVTLAGKYWSDASPCPQGVVALHQKGAGWAQPLGIQLEVFTPHHVLPRSCSQN